MARRDHFDAGHGNPEHSLENIMSKREQSEIAGRAIGEHLWNTVEDMMGGPGSFKASINLGASAMAHKHFQGENVKFDEEDYPYVHHQLTPDVHVKYPIPHYEHEGPEDKSYFYADVIKRNKRGENVAMDVLYIPGEARHNPKYLKAASEEWYKEAYIPNKRDYDRNADY